MLKKGSKLYSILTGSCPKCNQESMYLRKNPFILKDLYKMHESCSHCKTKYMIEPSFFYGAMYVSYGITVGVGLALFILLDVVLKQSVTITFVGIIFGLIILMPVTARLARNIYINLFIHFDKDWKKNS